MKRANTMSTITVELIIKMKIKFTSSNAEKTNGFISSQMSNFHTSCSPSFSFLLLLALLLDILCSCPHLPSRRPSLLFLLGLCFACACVVLPPVQFLPPSLGENSREPSSIRLCCMVCLRRRLMLKHKPNKPFC